MNPIGMCANPLVLLALVLTPVAAAAQTAYVCGMGTIVDVQFVAPPSSRVVVRTKRTYVGAPVVWFDAAAHRATGPTYFVTAELMGDFYTGQASARVEWNLDPTEFKADQAVDVCVNATTMVLDRLDGQDFRAQVVRVLRRTTPPPHRD